MFAYSMLYLHVMLRSSIVTLGLCYGAISACLGSINQPWFRMMERLRPAPSPMAKGASCHHKACCVTQLHGFIVFWKVFWKWIRDHLCRASFSADATWQNQSKPIMNTCGWVDQRDRRNFRCAASARRMYCTPVLQVSAGVLRVLMGPIPRTVSGLLLFKG